MAYDDYIFNASGAIAAFALTVVTSDGTKLKESYDYRNVPQYPTDDMIPCASMILTGGESFGSSYSAFMAGNPNVDFTLTQHIYIRAIRELGDIPNFNYQLLQFQEAYMNAMFLAQGLTTSFAGYIRPSDRPIAPKFSLRTVKWGDLELMTWEVSLPIHRNLL